MSRGEEYFRSDDLNRSFKAVAVRGGFFTITSQGARFAIRFGSTIILARLLTPQDFGLIAMVTAVTGFVALFKDLGLTAATVQRSEITPEQVSTLFWVNVSVSALLMLITMAVAPVVGWFYAEPKVVPITIALAVGILFGGLTAQHSALLKRRMRFGAIALIELVAVALAVAVSVVAAWIGFGYWALVLMHLLLPAAVMVGTWLCCSWRPGRPRRGVGTRSMVIFGGNLTGFTFANFAARNLDNLLIGHFFGARDLGLYSRAYQLLLLPLQQINAPFASVAVPMLSRLQTNPDRFREFYLKAVTLLSYASLPGTVVLLVLAEEVVLLALGPQWLEAAHLFRILGIASVFQPVTSTAGWIYVALGQTDRMFKWGVVFSAVLCAGIVSGLPWGVTGVAYGFSAAVIVLTVPILAAAYARSPIRLRDTFRATARPVALAGMSGAAAAGARFLVLAYDAEASLAIVLAAGVASAGISLLAAAALWRRLREECLEVLRFLRQSRRKTAEEAMPTLS